VSEQTTSIPIFDGHNDTLLNLSQTGRSFFEQTTEGHIDLPRAISGGLAGGFFAVWIPDSYLHGTDEGLASAQHFALTSIGRFYQLARASAGRVCVVQTAQELRDAIDHGVFAMELHIEGAEPIDPDLESLDAFYAAGVRSIGLVWSRSNAFGHGVPFQFPSSPDTGPGLTDVGKALVRACNHLGIMVDVSHLNEAGFWDVAQISDAPIVATHSGVHALSPATRNLTDKQLDAIRDSEGIVGVNFHVGFLRADGKANPDTPLTTIADHVDYLVNRLGADKVAFGSDFDGAIMAADLRDAAGLPALLAVLRARGYDDAALRCLGYENWLRVLGRTWKS
jgi:membrane dipeptidase